MYFNFDCTLKFCDYNTSLPCSYQLLTTTPYELSYSCLTTYISDLSILKFTELKADFLLTESVRKNAEHKSATAASIEKVMKEWFRTARDRDGGRRRRDVRTCESSDTA